ncbi:MAG TPA: hypothetical protein VFI23_05905 [Rhizomicrobium sp.]|nr:hypothetical protein [Rhizomicrobium sp.]
MDDATLKILMAGDAPAADPHFAFAVMKRIEQRRFRRELAQVTGLAAAAAVLLWLLAPVIETAWQESYAPYASNLVILLVLMAVSLVVPYFLPARE